VITQQDRSTDTNHPWRHGQYVPLQQAHELRELIPGSKLVVFQGAGHVPTLTMPLKVAGEISAFLKDLG